MGEHRALTLVSLEPGIEWQVGACGELGMDPDSAIRWIIFLDGAGRAAPADRSRFHDE